MIGRSVGHYSIVEKLGAGGMGEVYLAEDSVLRRKVAVKFLSEALERDPSATRRFLQEARSAAAIEHPFICQIFEIGEAAGRSFIAMEHVAGRTLGDELADGPIPVDRALRLASEIAEALEEAHTTGIVHRDLKPANIMLTPGGHIKVMDFGLAKRLAPDDEEESGETLTRLTEEGSTLGTVAYMSPEQLRAEEVDPRSDIFSFGILLYEMITGVHPFRRPTQIEMSSAILGEEPPPLARFVSDTPELLSHILRKMLAKTSDDRYQSVHEVRTDLADLRQGDSSGTVETLSPTPSARRRKWGTVGALVAALVAVGVVAWYLGRGDSDNEIATGRITSLAVLPLDNLMGDAEQQYFVDGMHDALITELSKIRALRVISRTSVLRVPEDQNSLEEIAETLDVDALVEGSIMRSEDSVRITAQLVGVRPERHLWAENFERRLGDVLALQSDVARAIASEVRVTLTPEEEDRLATHRPVPQAAHDSYLRGLYFSDQRGDEGMHKAQAALAEAIAIAPDWAPPYAALAEVHLWLTLFGDKAPIEVLPTARAYALEAIELDESLAGAHLTLARIDLAKDWDWAGAEEQVTRTLELNPNSSLAHDFYANILLTTGRTEEAIDELMAAMAIEPLAHRYT